MSQATLPGREDYERHVQTCRDCRYATNATVFPEARIPDDLCRLGKQLYDDYADGIWRYFIETYTT